MADVNLAAEIMKLMERNNASSSEGGSAIVAAAVICLYHDGFDKKQALKMIGASWDLLQPTFEQFKKEFN